MKGQSYTKPSNYSKMNNGYQIIWNVTQDVSKLLDGTSQTVYNYEYNVIYIPIELNYHEIIQAIVREKYSVQDEIKLAFSRESDISEKEEHEKYIEYAKSVAKNIIDNGNSL